MFPVMYVWSLSVTYATNVYNCRASQNICAPVSFLFRFCVWVLVDFTPLFQGYFTGTDAIIIALYWYRWSSLEEYRQLIYMHN